MLRKGKKMYEITIKTTTIEEKPDGKEWKIVGRRKDGGDKYGYTPEITRKKEVETTIYRQVVPKINIVEIINAVNCEMVNGK